MNQECEVGFTRRRRRVTLSVGWLFAAFGAGLLAAPAAVFGSPEVATRGVAGGSAEAPDARSWTLEKQESGIEVHTRAVTGSGIKEFRGRAEIAAGVDAILQVLRDSDGFKNWFPNCPESKLLARDANVSYQYSVMSTPWPISDRDNVFRSVTTRTPETGVIEIQVSAAPEYHPEQTGRVRVRRANGTWRLEPRGEDRALVTFTMHLDPGGGIPEWMINARIVATPFEALTNLRSTLGH